MPNLSKKEVWLKKVLDPLSVLKKGKHRKQSGGWGGRGGALWEEHQ